MESSAASHPSVGVEAYAVVPGGKPLARLWVQFEGGQVTVSLTRDQLLALSEESCRAVEDYALLLGSHQAALARRPDGTGNEPKGPAGSV
jgi:hypothetical protein